MEIPKEPGIYAITCIPTGEQYIGKSINLCYRINGHRNMLRAGKHNVPRLQAEWDRLGEDAFTFDVLEVLDIHVTEDEMLDREQYFFVERLLRTGNSGFNRTKDAGALVGPDDNRRRGPNPRGT